MITGIFVSVIDIIALIGLLIYLIMILNQKKYVVAGYVNKKKKYASEKKTLIAEVVIGIVFFILAYWLMDAQLMDKVNVSKENFILFLSIGILLILIGLFMILMAVDDSLYGEYDFKAFYVRQGIQTKKKK